MREARPRTEFFLRTAEGVAREELIATIAKGNAEIKTLTERLVRIEVSLSASRARAQTERG